MTLITINREKCIKCKLCVNICPVGIIEMGADCFPETFWEGCVACGQCVAVCPNAALDNKLAPLKNQPPRDKALDITKEQAEQFLRSRRSVRLFQDKEVFKDDIEKMLDISRFAPTGKNSQGVSYLVIQDKKILKKISAFTVEFLENQSGDENPTLAIMMKKRLEDFHQKGKDIVLLGAPCLILALMDIDNPFGGNQNAHLSMLYAQLYAPTIGLGTCWAGFAEYALLSGYAPVMELFKLPKGKRIAGAMMVGYPKYQYQRLTDRNQLEVTYQ